MKRKRSDEDSFRLPSGAAVKRPELTQALYLSFFQEWAHCGYRGISLERVAARAGAGKAAIYRRWDSKIAFATEAIEAVRSGFSELPLQPTLAEDIELYLMHLRRMLRHPLVRRILPDLHAEQARDSELGTVIQQLTDYRRSIGANWLNRAIERGELSAGIDIEFALDLIPSPIYWRLVIRKERISKREILKQARYLERALRSLETEYSQGRYFGTNRSR